MLGAVGLNLLTSIAMKLIANQGNIQFLLLVLSIGIVVVLNGLRLIVWLFANKNFPLSTTYPLTSIFYPLMLFVSFFFGEGISPAKIIGTILITIGVFWLGAKVKDEADQ
jgi:drug/metabolite transporter (DMT)-like permease